MLPPTCRTGAWAETALRGSAGGTGCSVACPAGGLEEAGDSAAGQSPDSEPLSLRKPVDMGLTQAGRRGFCVSVGGHSVCVHMLSPAWPDPAAGGSARRPLQSGPRGSSNRGAPWGGPPAPALTRSSVVTSQPAPARPRKCYCPCRLGSFLFLMKMNQTHRCGCSFYTSPTLNFLSFKLQREFPGKF